MIKEGAILCKNYVINMRYNSEGQWLATSGLISPFNTPNITAYFRVKNKIDLPELSGKPLKFMPTSKNGKIINDWSKAKML